MAAKHTFSRTPASPRPKKALGQHFLTDDAFSQRIVDALGPLPPAQALVEIGPGTGALTQFLVPQYREQLHLIEVDGDLVPALQKKYPALGERIHHADALEVSLATLFPQQRLTVIGNFPYNVASPLFFKLVEAHGQVQEVVCMVQREVALRLAATPGGKVYGVPSVWVQAFYDVEYLFTVPPAVFDPPPKVQSGVIRLRRNATAALPCDERRFLQVVKMAFHQRRKTLRNALRQLLPDPLPESPLWQQRAEQLSVADFVQLTQWLGG